MIWGFSVVTGGGYGGYGGGHGYGGGGGYEGGGYGSGFALIVVLFILLIIIGASFSGGH
ncbi:MAG: YjcZ family sporulation protein [Domibacillus tundrae]